MNVGVGSGEGCLERKSSRISLTVPRSMVRATIAASSRGRWNAIVCRDQRAKVGCELCVSTIGDKDDTFGSGEAEQSGSINLENFCGSDIGTHYPVMSKLTMAATDVPADA